MDKDAPLLTSGTANARCEPVPAPQPAPANSFLCVADAMGRIPKRWRPRLRRLSLGSEEGAMVRWSYHDGSTWAAVLFDKQRRDPAAIAGWAVYTLQEAEHPIVGVYVDPERRGRGYATILVNRLLDEYGHLTPHGKIYAVADWWPKYKELFAARGFRHLEWD